MMSTSTSLDMVEKPRFATPLIVACQHGHVNVFLAKKGIDFNFQAGVNQDKPLIIATGIGLVEVVESILARTPSFSWTNKTSKLTEWISSVAQLCSLRKYRCCKAPPGARRYRDQWSVVWHDPTQVCIHLQTPSDSEALKLLLERDDAYL